MLAAACSSKGKPAHFKSQFAKKQVVLGLLAVLGNVPDAALPAELAGGLPQLLSGLVRLLLDLKEQQDEAAKAGDSDEEDDDGPVRGGGLAGGAADGARVLFACRRMQLIGCCAGKMLRGMGNTHWTRKQTSTVARHMMTLACAAAGAAADVALLATLLHLRATREPFTLTAPCRHLLPLCAPNPLQDDVGADDGEDNEEEDAGGEEDEEYMKRLRKAALKMLKGEQGECGEIELWTRDPEVQYIGVRHARTKYRCRPA
jgi:hypothetical protein